MLFATENISVYLSTPINPLVCVRYGSVCATHKFNIINLFRCFALSLFYTRKM